MNKNNKIVIMIIILTLIALIIGLFVLLGGNWKNSEKFVYELKNEQYIREIEFSFKDNKAKSATITEKYINTALLQPNIIEIYKDNRYTILKETGDTIEYSYTEEGFSGFLDKSKEEINEYMMVLGYKLK